MKEYIQDKNITKFTNLILILFFFLFYYPSKAYCNKYFVSINGNDLNSGIIINPFLSIQKAINSSKSGDTIYIREGNYYEYITINQEYKNIYISNYKNENVVISPSILLDANNWISHSKNIYKLPLVDTVTQLFLNDSPIMQASYPEIKEGIFNISKAKKLYANADKTINIPGINNFNNLYGARLTALCSNKIIAIGGKIIQNKGDIATISDSNFFWNQSNLSTYIGSGVGFITGHISLLDNENEWYSDGNYLYFYTTDIENLKTQKLFARVKKNAFTLNNTSGIIIHGFNIMGGSIYINGGKDNVLTDLQIKYPVPFFHFWSGFDKFYPTWDGTKTNYAGPETWSGKGVEISGQNNKIENSYISKSWGDGITMYGSSNTIKNCIVEDCNWMAIDCAPLTITGENHLVQNNTFKNAPRSIIIHRKLKKSKILYNEISTGGTLCDDLGLTYCYDTDGENTEIAFNYLHNNGAKTNGAGIYLDENNSNHIIHHNIVANCLVGMNINKPSVNTYIFNNTLYKNIFSMGAWGNAGELTNVYTFNNLTDSDKKQGWNYDAFYGTQIDSNYLYTNNIFNDPINNNFELKPNSIAINSGIKNELTVDYLGTLPDKGALEFGKSAWKTGSSIVLQNVKNQIPYPVSNLSIVKNTNDSTFLKWKYIHGNIDSFYVQRKISTDTDYTTLKTVDSTIFHYNDTIKTLGEYRYQIIAKNINGKSEPSNSVEIFKKNIDFHSVILDAENNDIQNGTVISEETLGFIDNKDWISFRQVNFGDTTLDACKIKFAVPCEYSWQNIQIRKDGYMGEIIGEYITENTGGWDKFELKEFPIKPTSGTHDIYIKFKGKFGIGTIDWFLLYNSNGEVKNSIHHNSKCPEPFLSNTDIPVKLFPNPGNDLLRVSFENKELASATVEIYNTIGHKISTQSYTELYPGEIELYINSKEMDLELKSAFYIIKVNIESEYHNQETILKYIRL